MSTETFFDVLRLLTVALWAVSVIIIVAVVLTYNEARKKNPTRVGLLFKHVGLIGTSYLASISLNTYVVASRVGQEQFTLVTPIALFILLTGVLALKWVLGFQNLRAKGGVQ